MNTVLRLTNEQRAELFRAAAQRLGFGEVIVEKDFWVCWTCSSSSPCRESANT